MPYVEKLSLAGANAGAIGDEVYGLLDGALDAHPKWSKVTSGFTGNANYPFIDVWKSDGTADGFEWFLVVAKGNPGNASYAGRVLLGGMLEYDPATQVAKKALRGYNTPGFVDADGYPTVSAGGAEMTFQLSKFAASSSPSIGMLGGNNGSPAAPVAGNWTRILVTSKIAWIGWGTATTLTQCHGVGTYERLHSETADLRPLSFQGHTGGYFGGTVWQHPQATSGNYSRTNFQYYGSYVFSAGQASVGCGNVGDATPPLGSGFVGSRLAVRRYLNLTGMVSDANLATAGGLLGLTPSDLLVFQRTAGVQIGDTVTVNGKTYVSVDTPSMYPSLFINTQPED